MCDPHDQDDEGLVEDFVDDAVVADTDPAQVEKVALQDASPEWTLSKVVDSHERFGGAQPLECERAP